MIDKYIKRIKTYIPLCVKKILVIPVKYLLKLWVRVVLILHVRKCPLCETEKLLPVSSNHLYYHFYCPICDLAFVGNLPSMEDITTKYQENYLKVRYNHLKISNAIVEGEWEKWKENRNKTLIKLDIEKLEKQTSENRKVLEIGCAEGKQMELFIKRGWIATGIDISNPMVIAGKEKGLNIICDVIDEVTFHKEQFDLVIMSHTIEHFINPFEILRICWKVLKESGWLIIETPATPAFNDTDHMFFFSEKSLDKACEKIGFVKLKSFCNECFDIGSNSQDYISSYFKKII